MYKAISYSAEPYYKISNAVADLDSDVSKLSPNEAFYAKSFIPSFKKAILQEAKVNAYLELTGIGLSNKLYKNKYGKYVDSLSQLAPEFLQTVPLDPFTGREYTGIFPWRGRRYCLD
jgi:hypothetical protein